MQITITSAAGGALNLSGDLPAQGFQRFRMAVGSQLQEVPGLGAADITLFPRGNKKISFTFTVQRVLADAETAAYFAATHEEQFPAQGVLTYQTAPGTLYMRAVVQVTDLETLGATCTVSYRVTGGGFYRDTACTLIAPPPPEPIG